MSDERDWDGQPLNEAFNWDRRLDRGMDELIGAARGVLADGKFVVEEARFLFDWLERNEPVRRSFFGKVLYDSLRESLADNELSAEEEDILIGLLLRFVGPMTESASDTSYSTSLPLDDPPPPQVQFEERSFCFTGKCISGSRRHCQRTVISAGGSVHQYPIFATDYLVIGDLGSRDWIHSIGGRKIERAIEIRSLGHPIRLISEQHWAGFIVNSNKAVPSTPPALESQTITSVDSFQQRLAGKTIVVTGTLKHYKREEIEALIVKHGGRAAGSVSKKTDFLVAGEEAGSKLEKAKQLGVPVISEEEFQRMICK